MVNSTAFAWLGDLAERILSVWPKFLVVRATDKGVAFVRGKHVKRLDPGFHLYWPFWTEVEIIPCVTQIFSPRMQIVTTADQVSVVVGCKVTYRISSVLKALVRVHDYDKAVEEHTNSIIRDYFSTKSYEELQTSVGQINAGLTSALYRELNPFGLKVHHAGITDYARCKVLYLAGEAVSHGPTGEGT
jgi:regulator of protease activity HflC (stomatin/prohibitin superfamily)